MNRIFSFRLLALLAVVGVGCTPTPPNVVLIYVDDLGWRDVGFMGSTFYETPHIDRLAAEGTLFTQAYANAPNCAPSRASLMTGLYTPRHGIYTVGSPARGEAALRQLIPPPNLTALDTSFVTMAEVLRGAGYATAHLGKWHLGGDGSLPQDHGFDVNVAGDERGQPPGYFFPYQRGNNALPHLTDGEAGEYLTDRLTDEALAFLDAHTDGPFFLNLSHYAVHTPLQAPEALIEKYQQKPGTPEHHHAVYAAMIESVDQSVGRLLQRLADLGLADNTLVIFTSDNGGYGPATSMAPLRGAKGMLYEGGLRVPFAARWPKAIAAARTEATPILGIDLLPTLADLAGASLPRAVDGVSLADLLTDGTALPARPLYWHFPAYLQAYADQDTPWRTTPAGAIRVDNWKLVEFFEDGDVGLYNLDEDPGETLNLAATWPDRTRAMKRQLAAWRAETNAAMPTPKDDVVTVEGLLQDAPATDD